MTLPTWVRSVNWLSTVNDSRRWSVWRTRPQPESLLCNIDGCAHLWGGEAQFLEHVWGYWRARGYDIQLALADSVGAAWAIAHSSPFSLVKAGEGASALSRLPVETLRLNPAVVGAFGLWDWARSAMCLSSRESRWQPDSEYCYLKG